MRSIIHLVIIVLCLGESIAEARLNQLTLGRVLNYCLERYQMELNIEEIGPGDWTLDTPIVNVVNEKVFALHFASIDKESSAFQNVQTLRRCLADFGLALGLNQEQQQLATERPLHRYFDRISQVPMRDYYYPFLLDNYNTISRLESLGYFLVLDVVRRFAHPPPSWSAFGLFGFFRLENEALYRNINSYLHGTNAMVDYDRIAAIVTDWTADHMKRQGLLGYSQAFNSRIRLANLPADAQREVHLAEATFPLRADIEVSPACIKTFADYQAIIRQRYGRVNLGFRW